MNQNNHNRPRQGQIPPQNPQHPAQNPRQSPPQSTGRQLPPQNPRPQSRPNPGYPPAQRPGNPQRTAYPRPQQQMPQVYPEVRHKSRKKAQQTILMSVLTVVILVLLMVSLIILAARCATGQISGEDDTAPADTGTTASIVTTTAPAETETETVAVEALYTTIEKTAEDVHKGYLILVNYQNVYDFNGGFNLIPIYGNKNLSYKVRDTLVSLDEGVIAKLNEMMTAFEADTGKHDILVNSTFRTYEEQEALYAMRVEQYGEEYAAAYVSMPGHSEHHTGLAADFTIFTDDKVSTTFDKNPEYISWMTANGHKFGFIQRFPADKTDITKIAYEDWHYRYVGKPHAYYIAKNRLCLEEYIEALRKTSYAGEHLAFKDDDGIEWEVYFVPEDPSGVTEVKVPKYQEYELSGNNVDGFIVTVRVR